MTQFVAYTIETDRVIRDGRDNEFLPLRTATVKFTGVDTLDVIDNPTSTQSRTFRVLRGLAKADSGGVTGAGGNDKIYLGGQQGGKIDPLSAPVSQTFRF